MKKNLVISVVVFLSLVLIPSLVFAQTTRISNFKSTQDPVAANPSNISHTVTFTYTPQANDPALENFKVECGTATSGSTTWGKNVREFKCTYPKEPTKLYTVRLTPQASDGKPIGAPADLNIQIGTPPTTTPPTTPIPNPDVPYNDVATGLDIKNPSNQTDVVAVINKFINWLLLIIAMVAGVMIIYSGLMLIFNGGDQSRISKAKSILQWSIIGLTVAILSFALVSIVQGLLQR